MGAADRDAIDVGARDQCAEPSFTRRRRPCESRSSTRCREQRRNSAASLTVIAPDHRQALKSRIKDGNELSQSRRFLDLWDYSTLSGKRPSLTIHVRSYERSSTSGTI